jgi:hypothetical protein
MTQKTESVLTLAGPVGLTISVAFGDNQALINP